MMTLTGVTADDRFLLRTEATLSPLMVRVLAKAIEALEQKSPELDASERLARIIAAGCFSVLAAK